MLNGARSARTPSTATGSGSTGLRAENELRVVAECAYSRSGEGLHRFTDPADGGVYLYSDLETFDAHRVYACFDQPDLKASFELSVTAPAGWQVISNMAPDVAEEPGPGRRQPLALPADAGHVHLHHRHRGRPVPRVTAEHDGIPLGIYCRQSLAEYLDPEEIFEVTRQGFDFYHQAFGVRYPFGKYDQLFVPEFKAGAMENAGCVTFLEDYVFRSRVTDFAREIAGRDDPARDGAHVVRRPGHHALVGRPVAERVVRHLGGHARPGRGDPLDQRPGPRSRSCTRPGPTSRTSCRPPIRSRPTSRTSRRSRSTSTASPTPRARRCSSSWSPTSAGTTSWPGCAATSASTPGATRPSPTCWPRCRSRPAGTCPAGPSSGWKPPG